MKKNHTGIVIGVLLLSGLNALSVQAARDSLTINNSCKDTSISVEQILPKSQQGPQVSVDQCEVWTGSACKSPSTKKYSCSSKECTFKLTNKFTTDGILQNVSKSKKIEVNFKDRNGACTNLN